jgi:hypothetical protein
VRWPGEWSRATTPRPRPRATTTGCAPFAQSLIRVVLDGAIDESTATDVSANPHDFKPMLAEAMAGNGAVVG